MSDLFVPEHGKTFLVTPTGAQCARFYGVGEIKGVAQRGTIFRVTVNDSTASLNIYTGKTLQPGPEQATAAEKKTIIAFISNVRVREIAGKRKPIILAEEVGAVEEHVRKSWILATAWQTLERIEKLRINLSAGKEKKSDEVLDQGRLKVMWEHYALDDDKLDALAGTAINAVKSMWQQYHSTTRELIVELVKKAGKHGMERDRILSALKMKESPQDWIDDVIDELIMEGRCYESSSGVLTC